MANNISNIKERVLHIADIKHLTKEKFFASIGTTYGNFKGKNKETPLNSDVLANILSLYPDISPEWLLKGSGSILIKEFGKSKINIDDVVTDNDRFGELKDEVIPYGKGLPLIPISAMAGAFNGEVNIIEYECEHFVVPTFKGADFLISVKGSSMYPKYSPGDIVACKKLSLDTFFQWNKVYVVDTDQGPLIKRVKKGSSDNMILIVSDNHEYEPFELSRSSIYHIALVLGVIRLE